MPSSGWKTPPKGFDFAVEYLRLAVALCSHTDEAALRSAVSRAYYAAFHCARAKTGILVRNSPSVHFDVWNAIGDRKGPHARIVRKLGLGCHEERKIADYEAVIRYNWKATADRVVDEVKRIQLMIAGMP